MSVIDSRGYGVEVSGLGVVYCCVAKRIILDLIAVTVGDPMEECVAVVKFGECGGHHRWFPDIWFFFVTFHHAVFIHAHRYVPIRYQTSSFVSSS